MATRTAAARGYRRGQPQQPDLRYPGTVTGSAITTRMAGAYKQAMTHDPCAYCGGTATGWDHITPRHHGGSNSWTNLTGCCKTCNSSKTAHPLLLYMLARRVRADIADQLRELSTITGNPYARGIGDLTRGAM